MKKNKLKIFIIICIVLSICAFGYASYAYFITRISGNVSAIIAGWNFSFTKMTDIDGVMVPESLEGTTYYIDLAETCTNCSQGKIAPGSNGKFTVYVDAGSSTTKTESFIKMFNLNIEGMNSLPTGLKFCSDELCTVGAYDILALQSSEGLEIGKFSWDATAKKSGSTTVFWNWDYETGYDNEYQGKEIRFSMVASASQVVTEGENNQ